MRKPTFGICENKGADQLRGNRRLCFRFIVSIKVLYFRKKIKPLAIFCDCTARFVSDLVGTPENWFSYNEAQITSIFYIIQALNNVQTLIRMRSRICTFVVHISRCMYIQRSKTRKSIDGNETSQKKRIKCLPVKP